MSRVGTSIRLATLAALARTTLAGTVLARAALAGTALARAALARALTGTALARTTLAGRPEADRPPSEKQAGPLPFEDAILRPAGCRVREQRGRQVMPGDLRDDRIDPMVITGR